jgi:tetratricopeptide (TPR) repeat protein
MTPRVQRRFWIALMTLLAGATAGLTSIASAQTQPSGATGPTGPVVSPRPADRVPERAPVSLESITAQALVRVALADLKVNPDPHPADYRLALAMLRRASDLQPEDQDILRLAVEAAEQAGDLNALGDLLRRLIRLDPNDTVSQMSLIAIRIGAIQDVRDRLKVYENLLGPQGRTLDPSIRSRLALDAAILAREVGAGDAFVRNLTLATQLDSTNKDAAALAYAFFSTRVDDPIGRVELLLNLVKADPFDAGTYLLLARELAAHGAHAQARRFYRLLQRVDEKVGLLSGTEIANEEALQSWFVDGAEVTIDELTKVIRGARREIDELRRRVAAAGQPLSGVAQPEDIRLDLSTERIRLAAASAIGNDAAAADSASDMLKSIQDLDMWLANPSRRPRGWTDEFVRGEIRKWAVEGVWLRLLANQQVDLAEQQFRALTAGEGRIPRDVAQRLEGWLALRRGDLDGAATILEALDRTDPLATLGLGQISELRAEKETAFARYVEVWLAMPENYIGAWARERAARLQVRPVPQPPAARRLNALAEGVPMWLEDMIASPRSFMTLTASPLSPTLGPFEPMRVQIRLRNVGRIPLPVGPDSAISSRILFNPSIEAGPTQIRDQAIPEVIRLDRRFRLNPMESIEAVVWIEPGYSSWALQMVSPGPFRMRWRLLQGFRVDDQGLTVPGAFSLVSDVSSVTRSGLRMPTMEVGVLSQAVASSQGQEFANAVSVAALRLMRVGQPEQLKQDEARVLIGALLTRYSREGPIGRMYMLARLPNGSLAPAMAEFDEAIRRVSESDPGVMLVKLITRVTDPADPAFNAARAMADSSLAQAAEDHEQRLAARRTVYSLWSYTIHPMEAMLGTQDQSPPAQPAPGTAPASTPPPRSPLPQNEPPPAPAPSIP